ncbi:MAG: hypothetical protein HMLKMBBP_01996 [Planctomycetes bacterium]|nr:hypothetical protein [Planctomycetota bacterium]
MPNAVPPTVPPTAPPNAPPPPLPDVGASLPASYRVLERMHARQILTRLAVPLGVACTNGGPWLDVDWLPRLGAGTGDGAAADSAVATALTVVACAVTADAALVRVAAKGVLVRKTTVTSEGVYGALRHPYYAACMGFGATVLAAGPAAAIPAAAWLAAALVVFGLTARGEEAGLRAIHGAAWDVYAGRVPMLGLWHAKLPSGLRAARWANLVREGEPPRLLRFLAGTLVVFAFRFGGGTGTVLASAAGGLWLTSLLLHRSLRESGARRRDGVSSGA